MKTEKQYNQEIRESQYPWMTDDQFEGFNMLCDLVGGAHHVMGKVKPCGKGIEINIRNSGWSTYDYNALTRAVVLAHDRMIRFEIEPSGPGMLKLCFHKRHKRSDGRIWEIHPTIEDAIEKIRVGK